MDIEPASIPGLLFFSFPQFSTDWQTRSTTNHLAPEIYFRYFSDYESIDKTINVQICSKKERLYVLLSLLERDAPKSAIIFVAEQVLCEFEVLLITYHFVYKISSILGFHHLLGAFLSRGANWPSALMIGQQY